MRFGIHRGDALHQPRIINDLVLIQTFKLPTWSGLVVDRADGKWKLVEPTTGEFELYNLIADPFELENIANNGANTALVTELTILLENDRGLSLASPVCFAIFFPRRHRLCVSRCRAVMVYST